MKLTNKIAGVSALALMMGMSAPALAGGLADYLDDGDGYDDTYVAPATDNADAGMIAADEGDLFAEADAAPATAEPTGPDMGSLDDDQLAALDEEATCETIGNKTGGSETDSQGELRELQDQMSGNPCMANVAMGQDMNDNNDINGGNGGNNGASQSLVSANAPLLDSLAGSGDSTGGQEIDSLLQVNVGTPDRTSAGAEGPALIEANIGDGLIGGGGANGSGALQVTVLDAINGDGRLLDTDPSGGALEPLQVLGGVAALGLDPFIGGASGPSNEMGGLLELNTTPNDFDGPGDFNVIQANVPLGPLEGLVADTLGIEQVAVLNLIGQGGDVLTPVADINGALGLALGPLLGFGGDQ